ncbi:MAG TPA: 4a-hydroxytetrahydrobiopterin dehydratase [Thermoanaerobaculia bacterium]|jgi:pterin-4a-carbinolamine dehydratase|nr:4a-hydroxytetrahydrobiopterin dehydratase [Thermoanaerobaculia bacterium]
MSRSQTLEVGTGTETQLRRPPQRPPVDPLKSERVEQPLTVLQVMARLQSMPGWKLTSGGLGIRRTHMFPEVAVASAYVSFVAEMARAAKLPTAVTQRGRRVVVSLRAATQPVKVRRKGLTQSVFDVAKQLG